MTKKSDKYRRLIISENKTERQRTTQARSQLYRLIASFRKDAERSHDAKTRTIFEFAAEIISGLARALKHHEEQVNSQAENGEA